MNRKAIFAKIKELNLQKEVEKMYGRHYTNVGNAELIHLITTHTKRKSKPEVVKSCGKGCKCDKLIEVLRKKHILLGSEVAYINS